jgi:hypothetical protein
MSMKTRVCLVGLITCQMVCFAGDKPCQDEKRIWGRSYITESLGDKNPRLELGDLSQGPEHLVGMFELIRNSKETVPRLVLKGHLNKRGEFTANVSLEVSDQENGNWKVIESSFSDKIDVTLTGALNIDTLYVYVQLDAFQPYIGKFKFCRVVLQTGESEVFPMVWLTEKGD